MQSWLLGVAVCLVLGLLTEASAAALKLWHYRSPLLLSGNIVIVFGLGFGSLLWLLDSFAILSQFIVGAVFGLAYEAANFAFLKAWEFPGQRLLFLHGQTALTLGVGLAWGLILPTATISLHLIH